MGYRFRGGPRGLFVTWTFARTQSDRRYAYWVSRLGGMGPRKTWLLARALLLRGMISSPRRALRQAWVDFRGACNQRVDF